LALEQLETRLTPSLSTLASILAPYGTTPTAGLVMDGSGNLYGVASQGGAYGDGTVFEVAHGTSTQPPPIVTSSRLWALTRPTGPSTWRGTTRGRTPRTRRSIFTSKVTAPPGCPAGPT